MPAAAFLTLVSLGIFLFSMVYTGALKFISLSRFFYLLIGFSLAGIAFALVQSIHVLNPIDSRWNLWVQITYMLIVVLNPMLLLGFMEPRGRLRMILRFLLVLDGLVLLLVLWSALFHPELVSAGRIDDRWNMGTIAYLSAGVSMFNWIFGSVILIGTFRNIGGSGKHRYLSVGYLLLSAMSLSDALFITLFVPDGRMPTGFYPGLVGGLVFFHLFSAFSLSRSSREREEETVSSTHAMEDSKKELMRMAYFDEMTGRPNRKSFLLHLNHHIIDSQSMGKTKAVFLLDLDNFRDVNDTFGYNFGDLVIRDVGEKIEDRFGVRDRLYRLYGNQFAIIWDDVRDRGHALDLARLIHDDLTSLVEIDDENLYMGVSMGAVILPEDGEDVHEAFRRCESSLAEAKKDKNAFFFYTSELENRTRRKMSIVSALRESLKKELFDIVYQPIVHSDGSLAEMEALIRSRHSVLKDISPEVYIPVAESSGLIIPITWWLLDRVARDAISFSRRVNGIPININMSPKILKSRDLLSRLKALGEKYPISGSLIGFEITEGAIIENVDQVLQNLRSLRERGFKIALDDFGTGYSSLSYIKNLPLDKIKIDKRFVSGISRDHRDEALINSIISIADNLKLELVAEGVEMPNQLAYLIDRGCRFYQGYLFSKPVPLDEIIVKYSSSRNSISQV